MKKVISIILVLTMLISALCAFTASAEETTPGNGFVYANGTHFYLDGKTFYVAGCNSYNLFRTGTGGAPWGETQEEIIMHLLDGYCDTKAIDNCMAEMKAAGINVCRTWAFSSDAWHGFESYQNGEWVKNEYEFIQLDYICKSAAEHGIKLILVLENYWEAFGGIDAKLRALGLNAGNHSTRRAYFTNETCKKWYKEYASYLLNRTNYFTGVQYKDDKNLFAWDLMNEPRYQLDSGSDAECSSGTTLRNWVDEMASYIKSIDKNHMVFVGIEGHGSKYGFGGNEGNPFVYLQQSPYIDFCSAHPYPDENWANLSAAQTKTLTEKWIDDAHNVVKKPFMITEFNVVKQDQIEAYWRAVCDTVYEKDAGGVLFWDYQASDSLKDYRFYVNSSSPILNYFKQHSAQMLAKNGTTDPNPPSPSSDTDTIKPTTEIDTDKDKTLGDVNLDGAVDIIDVVLVRSHIISIKKLDSNAQKRADVNKDNNVDIIDVVIIRSSIINA